MKMNELKFSFFYSDFGIKETTPTKEIDILDLFKIYNSEKLINLSKGVREATGESQSILKSKLPFITPYGTFSKKANDKITHYNQNLIALDFDHLKPHEIEEIREICRHSENVIICALSPRNEGLKVLALINNDFTPENHTTSIKQNLSKIMSILGLEKYMPDHSQFTLSQALFLCHDSEMLFNLNARATNDPLQPHKPTRKEIISNNNNFNNNRIKNVINGILNRNIDTMINAMPGNRHATILLNIKAFGIIKTYATDLENEFYQRLQKAIEYSYFNDPSEALKQALITLDTIKDKATPQSIDIIEKIKEDNQSIELAYINFIQGSQYINGKDQVYKRGENLMYWIYDGFQIASIDIEEKSTLRIKFSGYPTAKKIDRLKTLPGVEITETNDGILLNGAIWLGEEKIIELKTLSHAN
jgi:hypothetical protein